MKNRGTFNGTSVEPDRAGGYVQRILVLDEEFTRKGEATMGSLVRVG